MNKIFHQTAPIIALNMMSESFQKFIITDSYTIESLKNDADIPDSVDKDNLVQNADIHHAHSYKLAESNGVLRWIDGDCIERIKGLCADAHDFKAEGKLDMLRYCLGKMTHYRVDALTYPHLHKGEPWNKYHVKFEDNLGRFIEKHQAEIKNIFFEPYKDVYKSCRASAIEMWKLGKEVVEIYERGEALTDDEKIQICIVCVKGIGDLWTTLAKELKI